ncbi:MAG: hypothetical protein OEM97_04185 [Acidimicrobiia bacterium]|nr:hypothetical protein [Acidimicrobiia bacterium]
MKRTTIYLPDDMKLRLEQIAQSEGTAHTPHGHTLHAAPTSASKPS